MVGPEPISRIPCMAKVQTSSQPGGGAAEGDAKTRVIGAGTGTSNFENVTGEGIVTKIIDSI